MLTVKIKPPRSADVLRKNPLGLYVDAIDWSRELDTDVPRSLDRFPRPEDLVAPPSAEAPFADPALGPQLDPDPSQTPERRSEEHTSELQSLLRTSYAVFC